MRAFYRDRGCAGGDIARLLCETVTSEAPDRSCEVVLDDDEAFEYAPRGMDEPETVVLFYDKLAPFQPDRQQNRARLVR